MTKVGDNQGPSRGRVLRFHVWIPSEPALGQAWPDDGPEAIAQPRSGEGLEGRGRGGTLPTLEGVRNAEGETSH